MSARLLLTIPILLILFIGCQRNPPPPAPEPQITPTASLPEESSPTPAVEDSSMEFIQILEPGPGSVVASPVRIVGIAGPLHDQSLFARIVLEDNEFLPEVPVIVQARPGERGSFEVEYHFVRGGHGRIQVYSLSPRDGGITHLTTVGVQLSPSGTDQIRRVDPHPERIAIYQPVKGQTVSGGVVTVEGFGLATFEQTLLVEVIDSQGNSVGMQIVTLTTDLGEPGPFQVIVPYLASSSGPGRIIVHDEMHLNSVEVTLEP
jgi:hypothetical protein